MSVLPPSFGDGVTCDIPYDEVMRYSPTYCENYYSADRTKTLIINVDMALQQLSDSTDAAIVSHHRHYFVTPAAP